MNIKLTIEETQAILNILAEKPFQQVAGLINNIVQQVQREQTQASPEDTPNVNEASS